MKKLSLFIFLFSLIQISASEFVLTFDEIKSSKFKKVKKKKIRKTRHKNYKKELDLANKKLEAYRYVTKMQLRSPIVMSSLLINEADQLGATTIQKIMATNSPSQVILSKLIGVSLPKNSKVVCQVIAKFKRICGECTRIIVDGKGHDIMATLYNKDGSQCVIGKVSDDKEKYLSGILISEMAQGALALSQSSIPTVGGNLISNTGSNKVSQGLINTGGELTSIMKEEYKTTEPIVTLDKGSRVIVQFKKEFSL